MPDHFLVEGTWRRRADEVHYKGSVVTYLMDARGLDNVTRINNSHLQWAVFSRAIAYPQGVLLKMQTNAYVWLPDNSLIEGSAGDVRQLVADHIQNRVVTAK